MPYDHPIEHSASLNDNQSNTTDRANAEKIGGDLFNDYYSKRHHAYENALHGNKRVLSAQIAQMVASNRDLVLEDIDQAEKTNDCYQNPCYYAEMYNILSENPTEAELKQQEDIRYYYLSRSAWFFALANNKDALVAKMYMMSSVNSVLMLKDAEDFDHLKDNPSYGAQLYETLARCALQRMLDQSKISAAFKQEGLEPPLSKILSSGLVGSTSGKTTFKPGRYSLSRCVVSLEFHASASNDDQNSQSGTLIFNDHSDHDHIRYAIEPIHYDGDIGHWLYNASKLALKLKHKNSPINSYIEQYLRVSPVSAISNVCNYFNTEPAIFHPSHNDYEDYLLHVLIKFYLLNNKAFKDIIGTQIQAMNLGELGVLARFSTDIKSTICYISTHDLVKRMIGLNWSYAIEQANDEDNMRSSPLYCAIIYHEVSECLPEGMQLSECHRWAGYFYSLVNYEARCVSMITHFVNNDQWQPKCDAYSPEIQQSSPFYCAEIFNQLVKKRQYQNEEEANEFLQQAYHLYLRAGKNVNASYISGRLQAATHSRRDNRHYQFYQAESNLAASSAVNEENSRFEY